MTASRLWLAIVVLVGAFALRVADLNTESIWHDEGWSIRAFRGPFTTPDDNTPYLYYLSGHLLWRLGGGESPLALRYVSVLFGVLTVALALRIGRRWYEAGVAFGVMVAALPLLWEYAQEVRAYVVVPLVALALLAGAEAVLRRQRGDPLPRRVWALVFAVELLGLYTHNLAVPLVVWLNVALGLAWLVRRDWRRMVTWAGLQIALILAYVPWLLTQSPSGTPLNTPPEPGLALVREVWYSYFLPVLAQLRDAGTVPLLDALGVAVLLAMVVLMVWRPDRRGWLLVSHALLVPVFSTALMLVANIDFHPRYYIAAAPGTLLVLIAGIYHVGARRASPLRRTSYGIAAAVVLLISAVSIRAVNTTRAYQHDDFAGLAAYYATLPPDAVILIPFNAERALQDYYADRIQAQFVNVPLYADEETALRTINSLITDAPRHVELLTWFQLPADPRGMYPCLLGRPGEERLYFGLSTQTFTLPTEPVAFTPLAIDPAYREVMLEQAGLIQREHSACLRTAWRSAPTENDVRVSASILNPLGEGIARDDYELTRPDNVGTARWEEATTGQVYHQLALPPDAPPLTYDLTLTVYDAANPNGFDLLDESGNPRGKTLLLADAFVGVGAHPDPITETTLVEAPTEPLESGRPFDLTLRIRSGYETPPVVALRSDEWTLEDTSPVDVRGGLSWQRFTPPSGGTAALTVNDATIATFEIRDVPRLFDVPEFAQPVDVTFTGVGTLVGADVDLPEEVTLVWQAAGDAPTDYTVFVQLIGEAGQVVAQSDKMPDRPTSGWVTGEYIMDRHTLRYNLPDYDGDVTLIAGMYDADFRRVTTTEGSDFALITASAPSRSESTP